MCNKLNLNKYNLYRDGKCVNNYNINFYSFKYSNLWKHSTFEYGQIILMHDKFKSAFKPWQKKIEVIEAEKVTSDSGSFLFC